MSIPELRSKPEAPLPFLDNGVAQIAFVVKDLDKTVEMYHRTFGIGGWHFYTYGTGLCQQMSYYGEPCEYRMRVALSYFGPMRVELIEMVEGPTVYADFVEAHGFGLQHLGVLVDDMAQAIAQAEAAGFRMIMDGSGFGPDGGGHYAYIDTDEVYGVTLELIERPARRHPPEKIYPPEK